MHVIKVLNVHISNVFSSSFRHVEPHYGFDSPPVRNLSLSIVLSARGRNATSSALSVTRLRAIPRSRLGRRIDSCLLSGDRFASRNIFHGFLSMPQPSIRRLFALLTSLKNASNVIEHAQFQNCFGPLKINIFRIHHISICLLVTMCRYESWSSDINRR